MEILESLRFALENRASDVFIVAGRPLAYKKGGRFTDMGEGRIMPEDSERLIRQVYELAHRSVDRLLSSGDDDFSFAVPELSRFRVSTYMQRGSLAAVIRVTRWWP